MPAAVPPADRDVLRRLAEEICHRAEDPVNRERREAWYALDAGEGDRPMVLAQFHAIRDRNPPLPDEILACTDDWARRVEKNLRGRLYAFDVLGDDRVIDATLDVNWRIDGGDYGVEIVMRHGGDEHLMGSRAWDSPIQDLDKDFAKLEPREFSVDRATTLAERERAEAILGDLLEVRLRGSPYWTMGMTWTAIELIGLENLMLAMYDQPDGLHRLMAFLRDDHLHFAEWLTAEGLYTLNNGNQPIGSGSMGFCRDLPATDWTEGDPVRPRDLWVLSESQETVGVGPDQFAEFIFPYQRAVAERFGKCYYGCCEPVDSRWHVLRQLANLHRVSVSPWADQEKMAAYLGRDYVYSRKPNPTLVSMPDFDEAAIREDLRRTLDLAGDLRLEIIMKDVHTLAEEPERLTRWVALAREEIARR